MAGYENHKINGLESTKRHLLIREVDAFAEQISRWGLAYTEFSKIFSKKQFTCYFEIFENLKKNEIIDFSICPYLPPICKFSEKRNEYFELIMKNKNITGFVFFNQNTGFSENLDFLEQENIELIEQDNLSIYYLDKMNADFRKIDMHREFNFSPVLGVCDTSRKIVPLIESTLSFYVNIFDDEGCLYGEQFC